MDSSIVVDDVDALGSGLPGFSRRIRRLQSGGSVTFSARQFGDATIVAGSYGFSVMTEGEVGRDHCVVALLATEQDEATTWNGATCDPSQAFFLGPGAEQLGVARARSVDEPFEWFGLAIPADRVGSIADRSGSASGRGIVLEGRSVHRLRALCSDVMRAGDDDLTTARRRLIERSVVDLVADFDGQAQDTRPAATWVVDECLQLADELGPMPSTMELAAGLGLSDRWVRAVFREVAGVSASTFFRARALDGARRDLLVARPPDETVTSVAMRWGFWHLGRFAAVYRAHFGESPSQTLAR